MGKTEEKGIKRKVGFGWAGRLVLTIPVLRDLTEGAVPITND